MNLPFKIASRYFFSRKKRGGFNAVSIISYISLTGYAVGAAALLIVLSVFNGFESLFIQMYTNFDADLQLLPASGKTFYIDQLPINKIKEITEIKGFSGVWEERAILKYDGKQTIATVKAVDDSYLTLNPLDSNLLRGAMLLKNGDTSFAVVGQGIGYQLGIDPDDQFSYLGIYLPKKGEVDQINPEGALAHGTVFPVGVFGVQDEVDNKYILLPLSYVSQLLGEEKTALTAIEFRLNDPSKMGEVKEKLTELLGENFVIKNRYEQRDSFFKVMKSEKTISYFILVFILLIAAFNTIGSLYMLVIEKKHDLEVLSSLGFTGKNAATVFMYQGFLIAVSGGVLGLVLGILVVLGQETYSWVPLQTSGSMMISAYPVKLIWKDLWMVLTTLITMGMVTAIYPAWKAYQAIDEAK